MKTLSDYLNEQLDKLAHLSPEQEKKVANKFAIFVILGTFVLFCGYSYLLTFVFDLFGLTLEDNTFTVLYLSSLGIVEWMAFLLGKIRSQIMILIYALLLTFLFAVILICFRIIR